MGDGAETEARPPPAPQAAAARGLPHAEAPDAHAPPNGERSGRGIVARTSFRWLWLAVQEVELQSRRDQFQLEELRQKQLLEKRQLPKKLKSDHKAKVTEVRKAIRSKKGDKDTLRKLDEQYIQLSQLETELMNERHDKEMETLRAELEFNMRELQEIQVSVEGGRWEGMGGGWEGIGGREAGCVVWAI